MSSNRESSSNSSSTPSDGVEYWQRLVREQQEIIEGLKQTVEKQGKRIEQLESELRAQKKLKGRPQIQPSRLHEAVGDAETEGTEKRGGSAKRSKKLTFQVDEERIIEPEVIPDGAKFNGYRDYDVQELVIKRHNIRFRLAEYVDEQGRTVVGQLPEGYGRGHYGSLLVGYVLYQHYQCRVPQPLLHEQLQEWGIEISTGQLNHLLSGNQESFHREQQQVLQVGLETAPYIHTDDTGARHQGKNGYCTVVGNEWFSYFLSSGTKSRQNFLELLQGEGARYVLNDEAQGYLESQPLAIKYRERLEFSDRVLAVERLDWHAYLQAQGIVSRKAVQVISEAALLGGVMAQGLQRPLRILSDGAGQFNVLWHGLCWVHAERGLRRLQGEDSQQRQNITEIQDLLWHYYRRLQQYQQQPTAVSPLELSQEFDVIFGRCYLVHERLNTLLQGFRAHKVELLRVLDYPLFPLHNNGAETDIREYVIRRKISGGTRSDAGRKARDTFVGLKKTCRKLGISFWQYLLSRLRQEPHIPPLSDVIRSKAAMLQVPAVT